MKKKLSKNKKGDKKNRLVKLKKQYDTLIDQEKQELLETLQNDVSRHKKVINEKTELVDYLKRSLEKKELIDKIDKLAKKTKNVVPVVSEKYNKTITIEVEEGLIQDVKGLPEGYDYDIVDYDCKGICKICGEEVLEHDWCEHLKEHNPNADNLD